MTHDCPKDKHELRHIQYRLYYCDKCQKWYYYNDELGVMLPYKKEIK